MKQLLFILLVFSALISCRQSYKQCECNNSDYKLQIYNDILTELIEHHFYNFYLGEDEEHIFEAYVRNPADSLKIDQEVIRLQNKLFKDTSRFCTIYLDTSLHDKLLPWSYFQKDTTSYSSELKAHFSSFTGDKQRIIDTLNQPQKQYYAEDFILCTAKNKSITEEKTDSIGCSIGKLAFSNLFLNKTGNKALLHYEFVCGGLCGRGELLVVEKLNGRWKIIKRFMTWIS